MKFRHYVISSLMATSCLSVAHADTIQQLDDIIVTANRVATPLSAVANTVQVFDEEEIRKSSAQSVTDLLANNGVGFFSQWTPGQTSINLRGMSTDGQGRDFKSRVLVLVNGRRAGTANLSKLSLDQVSRIEVIRGAASVAYGSQAMGGVINIMTKNGRNTVGGAASLSGGSFGYGKVTAEYGMESDGVYAYAGGSAMRRGDYDGGGDAGTQVNTTINRRGALAAMDFDLQNDAQLNVTLRTDGVYNTGFRGSSWDYDNDETRYNQSLDVQYSGDLPYFAGDLAAQVYAFRDVDDFHWGSEVSGWDSDSNRREITAAGMRLTPQFVLTDTTRLTVGLDTEFSKLDSSRFRMKLDGSTSSQVPPYDVNQNELLIGSFAELSQSYDEGRGEVRVGTRYTRSQLSLQETDNLNLSGDTDQTFTGWTYSAGTAYSALPWLKLRGSLATGFRAPNGSELAGKFSSVLSPNKVTYGNPDLDAETNRQFEVGATFTAPNAYVDVALFDNVIMDRITKKSTGANTYQQINSNGEARVQGLELQAQYDFADLLQLEGQSLRLGVNAAYNFTMKDHGENNAATGKYREKVQRMYEYQAAFNVTYAPSDVFDMTLSSVLNGPMYYNTEEWISGETDRNTVYRKGPFWVFGLRGNWALSDSVTLFGGVDNLLDENNHPMFIVLDDSPCIGNMAKSNGGCGNSMAGRSFFAGLKATF